MRLLGRTPLALVALLFASAPFFLPERAFACAPVDEPAQAPALPPSAEEKALAQQLFLEGMALEKAGDIEGALEKYLASRKLVPRRSNTKNAARCLDILRRSDEALAMYEVLIASFGTELDDLERAKIRKGMLELRRVVAAVRFLDGKGSLTIDDASCGTLPRKKNLYVLPGKRKLRLSHDGSPPIVQDLRLHAGETLQIRFGEWDDEEGDKSYRGPPPPRPWTWFVEGATGLALGPTLDSDAEREAQDGCAGNCPGVLGSYSVARVGQSIGHGFAVGLGVGYLDFWSTFARKPPDQTIVADESTMFTVHYELDETVRIRGPFMGPTLAWRRAFGNTSLVVRTMFGLVSAQSSDEFGSGKAWADGTVSWPVTVGGRAESRSATSILAPELGMDFGLGNWRLGLSLGFVFVLAEGDRFTPRPYGVYPPKCNAPGKVDPGCAPWPSTPLSGGATYRPAFLFVPQLVIGYFP